MHKVKFLLAALPFLTGQALAACETGVLDDLGASKLALVTTKTPLYNTWTRTGDTCKPNGSCGSEGYLIAGDEVVVRATDGAWACTDYTSKAGKAVWSRAVLLRNLKFVNPASSVVGTWKVEDQILYLRRAGNRLLVRGYTQWPWTSDPDPDMQERIKKGGVNIGQIDLVTPLIGGAAQYAFSAGQDEYDCKLQVRVLGPYLLATSQACGGLNAEFDGVYRRTSSGVKESDWQNAKMP